MVGRRGKTPLRFRACSAKMRAMNSTNNDVLDNVVAVTVDARGLTCPEPVMMLHNAVRDVGPGDLIKVEATDPSTLRDIPRFCEFLNHPLKQQAQEGDLYLFWVCKRGE